MLHANPMLPLVRRRTLCAFLVYWLLVVMITFSAAAGLGRFAPRTAFAIWAVVVGGGFCIYGYLFLKVYFVRCAACGDFFFRYWFGMTPWGLFRSRCVHCGDQPDAL